MNSKLSIQWSGWVSVIFIGILQVYVIYSSLSRYIMLKSETFHGYHMHIAEYKWIFFLLNFQLFIIIGALGILPIWFYSAMFSISSFFCKGFSPQLNRQGFKDLILKEAIDVFSQQKLEINNSLHQDYSRNCSCQKTIKLSSFYPIASIFQFLIAYLLLLPLPFIESWLIQIDHKNKGGIQANDAEFLISYGLLLKLNWNVEYFNFSISLIGLSLQFPNFIWGTNKLFSIAFSLLEFIVIFHILIDFPIISIVIKFLFKNCTVCEDGTGSVVVYSTILLIASVIGNLFLLLTFFSIFQFAHEKCVQSLLKSSWFFNNYRDDNVSFSTNLDQVPGHSNTITSALYSLDKIRNIKTSLYPFTSAALFFVSGIVLKCFTYYHFQEFRNSSKIFIIYFIQSAILIFVYFLFWFGISLKPKWSFSINDFEKRKTIHSPAFQSEEANYYKSLKSNLKTSLISLSSASNTNLSIHSTQMQSPNTRMDFTSPDPYINKCSSLKFAVQSRENQDLSDYIHLSQYLPQPRFYKTMYTSISSPKPLTDDRDRKLMLSTFYKCNNSNSLAKPAENSRHEDPYQMIKKSNMDFSIQEEASNENVSSISDDFSSNMTSSPNNDLKNKQNSNMKFVTFRLDNNAEIAAGLSTSTSNESLTVITLEQSEAFLKELEGDGSDKIHFNKFRKEINNDFRDKFIMPLEPAHCEADSFPLASHTKSSLL